MQDHVTHRSTDTALALQKFGVGQPVRRREDLRFVTGRGCYTDDLNLPGQAYAAMLRSPYAHAVIRSIDASAARGVRTTRKEISHELVVFAFIIVFVIIKLVII